MTIQTDEQRKAMFAKQNSPKAAKLPQRIRSPPDRKPFNAHNYANKIGGPKFLRWLRLQGLETKNMDLQTIDISYNHYKRDR